MVVTAVIYFLLLGIKTAYSIPVPPNDPPKIFSSSRPGTRIQFPQPVFIGVGEEFEPPPDMSFTAREPETDTASISIPSVNEERNGRGWINSIAGPPLDTFTNLGRTSFEDTKETPLYKQPFKGVRLRQESNVARLKTALEEDVEESYAENLANGNIANSGRESGQPTARFQTQAEQGGRPQLEFSDAEDQGIDIDLEDEDDTFEESKEPEYDPVRDPVFGDYPLRSPLRHTLRRLLEEPLFRPLPSSKEKPGRSVIKASDNSDRALRKMRHNLQPIVEGASILEMQSTRRDSDAPPGSRGKQGAINSKFLQQGRESLQLPSPGLNPGSQIGSLIHDTSHTEDNHREPQVITLTLPELSATLRKPKDVYTYAVPKLRLGKNGQR